jgi:putative oxidoreductase
MAAHGSQKAFGWFEGPGPEGAAKMMHQLGFRPGETFAPLASFNEMTSGVLTALGLGGPIGPGLMIANMVVAARTVHWKNGFFAQKGGFEVPALYAAAALTFAATDYGSISLDEVLGLRKSLREDWLVLLALAGGVAGAVLAIKSRDTTPPGPAQPTFRGKNSPLPDEAPAG